MQKSLLTVTVAGVVIVVLLSGALECTRTQWDKLKILGMFGGDVFLWNVSKQLVISCARLHWKGVYQRAHGWAIIGSYSYNAKWSKVMIIYGLNWQIITVLDAK